jgi:hypothetical protein
VFAEVCAAGEERVVETTREVAVGALVEELRVAIGETRRGSFPGLGSALDRYRAQLERLGEGTRQRRVLNDAVRGAASALETWRAVRAW